MDSIHIRPARPDDRERWCDLRVALWPEERTPHLAEIDAFFDRPADAPWPQAALLAEARDEGGAVALVGLAEVSVRPIAEGCLTQGVGYLEGWYVVPERRGTGVGRALLRGAEDWARGRGCTEMGSDTDPENAVSIAAHLALGFEDVGLVRCFRRTL